MTQLGKALNEDIIYQELLPTFISLLKDSEAEVKTAVCTQVPGSSYWLYHSLDLVS